MNAARAQAACLTTRSPVIDEATSGPREVSDTLRELHGSDLRVVPRRRPSSENHSRPGEVVSGRYRVVDIAGRGAWSVVYDAVHTGTDQRVALKMLLSGLPCGDDRAEARFFREAKITASLRHPNTVRVFDVGRTESGALYLASEFLEGPSLADVLHAREDAGMVMTPMEAYAIAEPILRSLHEAHEKGLVHRDLKPENIVITQVAGEPVIKVLDFGIAWLQGQKITRRGVSLGSPHYMSPEQCARQDLDGRSDLYALSVLLYRCVTGVLPFDADEPLAVLEMHRTVAPDDPRAHTEQTLPEAFVACLLKGLSKHPMGRFESALAMREALRDAVAGRARPVRASTARLSAIPPAVLAAAEEVHAAARPSVAAERAGAAHGKAAPERGGATAPGRDTLRYTRVSQEMLAQRQTPPQVWAQAPSKPVMAAQTPAAPPVPAPATPAVAHARTRLWPVASALALGAALVVLMVAL